MKREERAILDAARAGDADAIEEIASEDQPAQRHLSRRDEESPRRGDRQKGRRVSKRTLVLETNIEGEKGTMKNDKTKVAKVAKATPPDNKPTNVNPPANTTPQPVHQFSPCALCGHGKSDAKFLVCKADDDRYKAYINEAAKKAVATGKAEKVLSKPEWVLEQLDLGRFETELEEVRQKRVGVHERAIEKARQNVAGQQQPREYIVALIAQYEQQEGSELTFQARRLFGRLQAAQKLKPDLEKMIAEKATQAAAATTPAQEETPAEVPAGT